MAVTFTQVTAALEPEEPDYAKAARLGPDAIPHLQRLVDSGDPNLASKATYLAGRIGDPEAVPVLEAAAASPDPGIRAAAAGGARHLPDNAAERVLLRLVDDEWAGVRKAALRAVPDNAGPALAARVARRRTLEPEGAIRDLADDVSRRMLPEP